MKDELLKISRSEVIRGLRKENIYLKKVQRILGNDCKELNNKLDKFLNSFAKVLLKKQLEIQKLKKKIKKLKESKSR